MDFIEVQAKTVEEALTEASIQLETSSDNIEYEILQRGSNGFLGIGSKKAIIKARKKAEAEDEFSFENVTAEPLKKEKAEKRVKSQVSKPQPAKAPVKEHTKPSEKKTVKKIEKPVEKEAEKPEKESVKKEPVDKEAVTLRVKSFLEETFKAMQMQVEIEISFDEEEALNIELSGPEMGILIGKRGQTLDSIQYLTSLVANKGNAAYVRVKLDTENYRKRRRETLENLAKNIASKVRRTKKTVFLEPMNPYERRIIHSALQSNPYVATHSEGEEPYRKVVVTLKK